MWKQESAHSKTTVWWKTLSLFYSLIRSFLQDKLDKEDIQEALSNIDKNHDGEVNFREFSQCVAALAKGYFKKKHSMDKKGKSK